MLSLLLALGPFLHAHFGIATVSGFHMAGYNSVTVSSEPVFGMTGISQLDEQESASVGVETAYLKQIELDVQQPPDVFFILTGFVLALVDLNISSCLPRPYPQVPGRSNFLAGFPPLTHAPPTFSL